MGKAKGFEVLEALRPKLPKGPEPKPAAPPPPPKGPARAVVRYERKGHGGKEATVIEKLELKPKDLEIWCKELKASLGCGGSVAGDSIVLQGDQRPRLPKLLEEKHVGKITISG